MGMAEARVHGVWGMQTPLWGVVMGHGVGLMRQRLQVAMGYPLS
jgi:hypothetical protein